MNFDPNMLSSLMSMMNANNSGASQPQNGSPLAGLLLPLMSMFNSQGQRSGENGEGNKNPDDPHSQAAARPVTENYGKSGANRFATINTLGAINDPAFSAAERQARQEPAADGNNALMNMLPMLLGMMNGGKNQSAPDYRTPAKTAAADPQPEEELSPLRPEPEAPKGSAREKSVFDNVGFAGGEVRYFMEKLWRIKRKKP